MSKKRKTKKKSKSGKNRTTLLDHKKVGTQLQSAFGQLQNDLGEKMAFSSWSNDRLPEMVWVAVIRVIDGQNYAISEFRRILEFIVGHESKEKFHDITLTGISKLETNLREELISVILQNPKTAMALTVLSLCETLPSRETWLQKLPKSPPNLDILMSAIGFNLPHQSQEATDCRWFRLMAQIFAGKMHMPKEMLEKLIDYPYKGDLREVRPLIRTSEMAQNPLEEKDLSWPESFWEETWLKLPCLELMKTNVPPESPESKIDRSKVISICGKLEDHWSETHSTTAIDAKHDAIFGLTFYVLRVLDELLESGISTGILGRLGLRTILECHISLRYLLLKDDKQLWKKWRVYGAGQAKLNALRFDELMEAPQHIDISTIETIAGEDTWEEFLNIELGSWSGLDLRKLSERANVKEAYDKHYSWTSGYSHGTWGPIRESCYETCGNPLHRLHRYPKRKVLPDTSKDAAILINFILEDMNSAYPGFKSRL